MCAKVNQAGQKSAELLKRPVVSEPFWAVAIDLVGPLPKGRGGAQYLFTYSCMATMWPEVVPLRGVSAADVA